MAQREGTACDADPGFLVGLYSNMKPVQAAAILQRLDTHLGGPSLAAMDPAAALAITEQLEQRRAAFRP